MCRTLKGVPVIQSPPLLAHPWTHRLQRSWLIFTCRKLGWGIAHVAEFLPTQYQKKKKKKERKKEKEEVSTLVSL
jgi:hypothetical protein